VHIDYYLETDADPTIGLQEVYSGDLTIKPGGGSFYWNATTGTEITNQNPGNGGMPQKAALNPDQYYVWFDDTTDTLVINGRIPVDGDINLVSGSGTSNRTINYEGKGTMLAFDSTGNGVADVELSANLITTNFPNDNLIGLHAERDFKLGQTAQINIMGGFYSQGSIAVNKQTNIVGTIVGNYFDMGGQVPSIFQVPTLEAAWEDYMRMIGADPTAAPQPLAWMEFNVL
jgi:hypothetical protein